MAAAPPGVDLSEVPLALNPNGDPPNFNGGPSLQTTILVTGIIFIVISLVFLTIRIVTGLVNTRKLHLDDYFCLLGELSGVAYWFVLYKLQVEHGTAKHSWDIPASTITPTVMKGQSAAQVLTSVANPLVKGAILLFFIRLFGTLRWIRIFCHGLLVTTIVLYGAYLIALLSLCIPARGQPWDTALLARCATTTPATITIGVCAVVIDLAMFVMPFFIVARLNVKRDTKKGLALVFLVGFLIVVTSVVGLVYRVNVSFRSVDPIWDGAKVSITAYIEIFGTVIVSCTPASSSFWFNIFLKSSLYSSLRSRFSRSRLQGRSMSSDSAPRQDYSERMPSSDAEYYSQHQPSNSPRKPSSIQELVDPPVIPLQSIHKSTLITQHSTDNLVDTDGQKDLQARSKRIIRDEW